MNRPKDFTIFKIRYYADGINVRKGIFSDSNNTEQKRQHWERAKEYNSFFWTMVEKATGHPMVYWATQYFMSASECAREELFDRHTIYIPECEEHYYWFIPNSKTELIEWVKTNCQLPYKIVKRCSYSSNLNNEKTTWRRKQAEEFRKNTIEKVMSQQPNTLREAILKWFKEKHELADSELEFKDWNSIHVSEIIEEFLEDHNISVDPQTVGHKTT